MMMNSDRDSFSFSLMCIYLFHRFKKRNKYTFIIYYLLFILNHSFIHTFTLVIFYLFIYFFSDISFKVSIFLAFDFAKLPKSSSAT